AVHGGITTLHGGGNSLLRVTATSERAFLTQSVSGGTNITRPDGLAWANFGFATGQTLLFDGTEIGTVSSVNTNVLTVTGTNVVALNTTGASHSIGIKDSKGHARNKVPDPFVSAQPADSHM